MPKLCTFCKSSEHTQFYCRLKPRKPIKKQGKKALRNKQTTQAWRKQNTEFVCYLRISPQCLVYLDEQTAVPEHVVAKGRGQKYAHDIDNIKASCSPCNLLKSSSTLEALAKTYPHLLALTQGNGSDIIKE